MSSTRLILNNKECIFDSICLRSENENHNVQTLLCLTLLCGQDEQPKSANELFLEGFFRID